MIFNCYEKYNYKNNYHCFCLDKQQEVDINNLRLSEDDSHQRSKGNGRGKIAPPLSQISGVKKPLGHTNSFSGSKLPEYGVESKHPEDLAQVQYRTLQYSTVHADYRLTYWMNPENENRIEQE